MVRVQGRSRVKVETAHSTKCPHRNETKAKSRNQWEDEQFQDSILYSGESRRKYYIILCMGGLSQSSIMTFDFDFM